MTRSERREIEQDCARLIILYAHLNDHARWQEVAALFTDDGWFTRPTAPDERIVGRDTILASFLSRPARYTRHACINILVDVESPTVATATSMILLYPGNDNPDGGLPLRATDQPLVGDYRDRFALTSDGWRFAERRGRLSFA